MNITLALSTTRFLDKEHEYLPWHTARDNLGYILLMFDRSEVFGPIQVGPKPGCKSSVCIGIQPLVPLQRRSCELLWSAAAFPTLCSSSGLPEGKGHASLPLLQEGHGQLDQEPGQTHRPVRTSRCFCSQLLDHRQTSLLAGPGPPPDLSVALARRYNQVNAISLACSAGVPGCKELTAGWFRAWMRNPAENMYSSTLTSAALCSSGR